MEIALCVANHSRHRLPHSRPGARCRIRLGLVVGLLRHANDKYASRLRNIDLPIFPILFSKPPLQKEPEHLHVRWAESHYNKVSVFILRVRVRAFETKVKEKRVVLVDGASECNLPRSREDIIVGLVDR